jgi:hypothetical protein
VKCILDADVRMYIKHAFCLVITTDGEYYNIFLSTSDSASEQSQICTTFLKIYELLQNSRRWSSILRTVQNSVAVTPVTWDFCTPGPEEMEDRSMT